MTPDHERQPEEIQRRIAQLITEELAEREWDALVSSAASQQFLAHLSAGIDAQEAVGEVEDGGWELYSATLSVSKRRADNGHAAFGVLIDHRAKTLEAI